MSTALKAPFPYFGGKSKIAPLVWQYFGNVANYVEPFAGSLAVLLSAPRAPGRIETVNDTNGYICNFWRAVAQHADETARYADWPVNESDLHARHVWLIRQKESLVSRLEGDPEWCDPKAAGWWVWGICNWIGGSWCDAKSGPWWVSDGQFVHLGNAGQGVSRQFVHLGNAGQGVSRRRVQLGNAGQGVSRRLVHLGTAGQGVSRRRVHLGDGLYQWFADLSDRLRLVRVCCGDWSRVMGPSVTTTHGVTGVFLDPPYLHEVDGMTRDKGCYGEHDCGQVALDVAKWCRENGDNPKLRIILCGYEGEHQLPGWDVVPWKATGGYASQGKNGSANASRERLWVSPHCIRSRTLF